MKAMIVIAALSTAAGLLAAAGPTSGPAPSGMIIACEQAKHRLLLLDAAAPWERDTAGAWAWSAADAADIAKDHQAWFKYPSEAKPVLGGTHVLATFSSNAVVLVRLRDHKTIFYANAGGNPHSATLLPDGNIATASSEGGYLTLFHVVPSDPPHSEHVVSKRVPMRDAHGVHWDEARQRLWALGGDELKRFRYLPDSLDLNRRCSVRPSRCRRRQARGRP